MLHIRRNAKRFLSQACSTDVVRRSGLCEGHSASPVFSSRRCQNPDIRAGDICGPTKAPPHRGSRHAWFSRGGVDDASLSVFPASRTRPSLLSFARHSDWAQPLRAGSSCIRMPWGLNCLSYIRVLPSEQKKIEEALCRIVMVAAFCGFLRDSG